MDIIIDAQGNGCCVYGEDISLSSLGEVSIRRASHVEPDDKGRWWVDLSPVRGPMLGPFAQRSEALEAEHKWLGMWITTSPRASAMDSRSLAHDLSG
jgi:hypothetical protein